MKKLYFCIVFIIFGLNVFSQTRQYRPVSGLENQSYQSINKNVWPNDIIESFNLYKETFVGWVGIVEEYFTDTSNDEYNVIGFYLKHHYYDWIEDFGLSGQPIRLSPDGEGYFICYFYAKKEFDINELTKDIVGNCIINYGYPIEISDDNVITMSTEYMRNIPKQYVNPNWLKYGRNGLDILN